MSIVEDFDELNPYCEAKQTEPEQPQFVAPLPPQATKVRHQERRVGKDSETKIHTLTKELNTLLSSCKEEQKVRIACGLQRIISEQRDVQLLMSVMNRLEEEADGWSKHDMNEIARLLEEYTTRYDQKLSTTNNALLTLRTELARVGELCNSLTAALMKHSSEVADLRSAMNASNDSVQKLSDELTKKMEALRQQQEQHQAYMAEQVAQRNACNFAAFFPPPPPPCPLRHLQCSQVDLRNAENKMVEELQCQEALLIEQRTRLRLRFLPPLDNWRKI